MKQIELFLLLAVVPAASAVVSVSALAVVPVATSGSTADPVPARVLRDLGGFLATKTSTSHRFGESKARERKGS